MIYFCFKHPVLEKTPNQNKKNPDFKHNIHDEFATETCSSYTLSKINQSLIHLLSMNLIKCCHEQIWTHGAEINLWILACVKRSIPISIHTYIPCEGLENKRLICLSKMLSVKYDWINVPSMLLKYPLVQTCCKCSCRCKVFGRSNNKIHFRKCRNAAGLYTYIQWKCRHALYTHAYVCTQVVKVINLGKNSSLDIYYSIQLFGKKQQL